MKSKRFKRIDDKVVDRILSDFDNAAIDGALSQVYNHKPPSEVHEAVDILYWWVQTKKATLRKSQLYQLWKKLVQKTMGKNYANKDALPSNDKKMGDILYEYMNYPFLGQHLLEKYL